MNIAITTVLVAAFLHKWKQSNRWTLIRTVTIQQSNNPLFDTKLEIEANGSGTLRGMIFRGATTLGKTNHHETKMLILSASKQL